MGWWARTVAPRLADRSLDSEETHRLRSRVCAGLRGEVVEIGFGSGLNVRHYPTDIAAVQAIEPSDLAWRLAVPRLEQSAVVVTRAGLDGERLPGGTASADFVLSTFTLCSIPKLDRALAEVARVLRPGGTLHFLEHGRAPDESVLRWQRRLEPIQRRVFAGCHLTRPIGDDIRASGLVIDDLETFYLPGPASSRPFAYVYRGHASKPCG